jgi:hypothetical protein
MLKFATVFYFDIDMQAFPQKKQLKNTNKNGLYCCELKIKGVNLHPHFR